MTSVMLHSQLRDDLFAKFAEFAPGLGGLALGGIEADVCKKMFALQHVSNSKSFAHVSVLDSNFCTFGIQSEN